MEKLGLNAFLVFQLIAAAMAIFGLLLEPLKAATLLGWVFCVVVIFAGVEAVFRKSA